MTKLSFPGGRDEDSGAVEPLREQLATCERMIRELEKKNARLEREKEALAERTTKQEEVRQKMGATLRETREKVREFRKAFGMYLPGKWYSPLPSREDVERALDAAGDEAPELREIDLNRDAQQELLEAFRDYYDELPFPEEPTDGFRYFYNQGWFSYADAIYYYAFLRQHRPGKIVEVGSGFSSALALDTVERFFDEKPEMTFIDPNPERLDGLLTPADQDICRVIREPVQDVDLSVFESLQSGDLLFIDSSHVAKLGSDLVHLFFTVLPRVKPGVFVHFHDVFFPFEYPAAWMEEGRFWNEAYLLRAFLAYNREWQIHLFTTYVEVEFRDLLESAMPLCLKNNSGSIYLHRNPD